MADPGRAALTILLSTFDGERHLDELLRSVRAQSFDDWTMVCRDDGSSDGTRAVLQRHAAADARIHIIDDDRGRLGPAASFFALLAAVDTEMFAFCDQDDVWERHKLAWSVDELRRATAPIAAVYTDAWIADDNARVVRASALADRGVRRPPEFGELLLVNAAIGATMIGTRALAEAVTAFDHEPTMHDWWTALVAAYAGELRLLAVPTLRWRRHADTATGGAGGTGSIGRARRNDYLAWSVAAARRLTDSPLTPTDRRISRAVVAMAAMDESGISLRGSLRADRAGARAWPLRRRLAVHAGSLHVT
ncbi:MAG: glycosyltransferase [Acidimicrobiales bacterium]